MNATFTGISTSLMRDRDGGYSEIWTGIPDVR
jgi:hypothetical protein